MSRTASRYSRASPRSREPRRPPQLGDALARPSRACCGRRQSARAARRGIGAAAVAEQPLEDDPRVVFHRQRRRRAAPGDGIGVGAAEAGVARAGEVAPSSASSSDASWVCSAELLRSNLIDRDAGLDLGRVGSLRLNAGQEPRRRARMHAGAVPAAEPAACCASPLSTTSRSRNGSAAAGREELEAGALRRRRPLLHDHAVRHVDDTEAATALAGVCACAASAGTMPSSSGSASVAPRPRRTVRRGIAFLVMIMILLSASETACS